MTSMFNPIVDDNFYISCYHPIPTVVPIAEVLFFSIKTGWWFGTMEFYEFPCLGNNTPI